MKTCATPGCDKQHRARGLCSTHYNQTYVPNRHPKSRRECVVCGASVVRMIRPNRRTTCSPECRRALTSGSTGETAYCWATDAAVRAKRFGALVVETFDRADVFERDSWICYLCGDLTDRDASVFDPKSPTVDHVLPLSRGGEHSRANARTACLACNSAKGNDLLKIA